MTFTPVYPAELVRVARKVAVPTGLFSTDSPSCHGRFNIWGSRQRLDARDRLLIVMLSD
jgi:hypothetical protein